MNWASHQPDLPIIDSTTAGYLYPAGYNWKDAGGDDAAIELYGRDVESGTFEMFTEKVIGKDAFPMIQEASAVPPDHQIADSGLIVDAADQLLPRSGKHPHPRKLSYAGLGQRNRSINILLPFRLQHDQRAIAAASIVGIFFLSPRSRNFVT